MATKGFSTVLDRKISGVTSKKKVQKDSETQKLRSFATLGLEYISEGEDNNLDWNVWGYGFSLIVYYCGGNVFLDR